MTKNQDPLAGLKAVTEHLNKNTPEADAKATIKASLVLLLDLSPLDLEEGIDYLKARCKLPVSWWSALKKDVREKRKKAQNQNTKAKFGELEEVNRVHPAIDFQDEFMAIGFRVDLPDNVTGLLMVISDGESVRVEVGPETVEMRGRAYQVKQGAPPYLREVWGLDRLKPFLDRPTRPEELYSNLIAAYKTFLDLPDAAYGLMVAWTVGTYYAHLFTAFPFLHFHGPKESGKSKSLEAMRCVCFNAWKGRDISIPAFADSMDSQRGTLLLDQAEKLQSDKETGNLIGLLADSYKKAGGQRRVMDVSKNGRSVLEFSTYGPKAFASTKDLDPDLRDRCIKIPMTRTRKRLPDLEGWEPIWVDLRDKLYRFALASFKTVRQHYEENPGNGTRIGELWRPMLAVLLALGVEQVEMESIHTLFMEAAQEGRHEPTGWECTLLEVLREEAQAHDNHFEMTVSEILKAMNIEGDKQPGGKWVGDALSRYHLFQGRRRTKIEGKKETAYQFNPARVKELVEIYLREPPLNDLSHLSPGENTNFSNGFGGTRENQGTRPYLSPLEKVGHEGHEGTCPPKTTCLIYDTEITKDNEMGHEGHEKSGGVEEKYSHFFGDEVEL
jgi:hypothetical protein